MARESACFWIFLRLAQLENSALLKYYLKGI
jgi:hypothetical protein